jgi:hypothetical protein
VAAVDQAKVDAWLACFLGPRYKGPSNRKQYLAQMEAAVAEMRAVGADVLFPLLGPMLAVEGNSWMTVLEVILRVDAQRGLELALPLLHDPSSSRRWIATMTVGELGGAAAVPALLAALKSDESPQVRGAAAHGLGFSGGPECLPALLEAMASDHDVDSQGFTASHSASMAIDRILGTDETCLHFGELSRMRDGEPDLDRLRQLAEEYYRQWSASRG